LRTHEESDEKKFTLENIFENLTSIERGVVNPMMGVKKVENLLYYKAEARS